MDPMLLLTELTSLIMAIVRRHFVQTGEILTDEQAFEMLRADLGEGKGKILAFFIEKGWTPPE